MCTALSVSFRGTKRANLTGVNMPRSFALGTQIALLFTLLDEVANIFKCSFNQRNDKKNNSVCRVASVCVPVRGQSYRTFSKINRN